MTPEQENAELKEALELGIKFLDSLPEGWLAHTTGDIALLNEFFIKTRKLGFLK